MALINPMNLAIAAGGTLVVLVAIAVLLERDLEDATERVSRMAWGTIIGVGTAAVTVLAVGIDLLVTQAPELVVGGLGLGAVAAGFNLPVASAIMLIGYVVLAAWKGD